MMVTKLGTKETIIYFVLWISATLYSLYKLYDVQTELLKEHANITFSELKPGWSFIPRLKDFSDYEWSTWLFFFFSSWHYLLLHFIVAELLRRFCISILPYWYIIISIVYVNTLFGFKQVIAVICQPIIFALITFLGGKKVTVWLTAISILITIHFLKYTNIVWNFFEHDNLDNEEVYLLLIGLGWTELRCIAYCINFIDLREKYCAKVASENINIYNKMTNNNLVNMFSYVLYLPTLYTGPIIFYEDFKETFVPRKIGVLIKMKIFVKDMTIYLLYTLLLDLAFHYIYFLAMQENVQMIRKFPSMALCGGGLWMGLQFHMKYVISYGTAGSFARLDNIHPPPTPRCIARIHVYSQMWRYFDVGLYKFLIRYIYKPAIATISQYTKLGKFQLKQTASFITFIFIFIWHGTTLSIFVWSLLNYIGITLEQIGDTIVESNWYKNFRIKYLKCDKMEIRFKALVCAPLFAMSAISSFYLFGGYKIGSLFFEYSMQPSLWSAFIILISLYSCCHVSIALNNVSSRTDYRCMKDISLRP